MPISGGRMQETYLPDISTDTSSPGVASTEVSSLDEPERTLASPSTQNAAVEAHPDIPGATILQDHSDVTHDPELSAVQSEPSYQTGYPPLDENPAVQAGTQNSTNATAISASFRVLQAVTLPVAITGFITPTIRLSATVKDPRVETPIAGFADSFPVSCRARVPEAVAKLFQSKPNDVCLSGSLRDHCFAKLYDACTIDSGFKGNPNVYGLGIRTAIYLQWLVSLFGNHVVPEAQKGLANAYLLVCLFYCGYTYVFVYTAACTFEQEMKIMIHIVTGGFLCVYLIPPEQTSKTELKYQGLDWNLASRYAMLGFLATSILYDFLAEVGMFNGGIFLNPCLNSTIFLGLAGPLSVVRGTRIEPYLGWVPVQAFAVFGFLPIPFFIVAFLVTFPGDIARSILDSSLVKAVRNYQHSTWPSMRRDREEERTDPQRTDPVCVPRKKLNVYRRFQNHMKEQLGIFMVPLPQSAQAKRRASIFMKITGCLSFIILVLDIERIIATNDIEGVNDMDSPAQWLAVVFSFLACFPVLRDLALHYLVSSQLALSEDPSISNLKIKGGRIRLESCNQQSDPEHGTSLNTLSHGVGQQDQSGASTDEHTMSGAIPSLAPEVIDHSSRSSLRNDRQHELPITCSFGFQSPDGTWR